MLYEYLKQLLAKQSLTRKEAEGAMDAILANADPHQVAAFLAILKYRGETPEEVAGLLDALNKRALHVPLDFPVIDIVGTGGDHANTVNISTGSAILAAACGIPVAKHGNRSVSSQSGSADVLEAFGIDIEIPPEKVERSLRAANIAFMFGPYYNPSLKVLAPIRKGLRLATIFNLMGPMLNPAQAEYVVMGAANESMMELLSKAIVEMGRMKRALVFCGGGLDELTPIGPAIGYEISGGRRERMELDPRALGFAPCTLKDLQGGNAAMNAMLLKEAFAGKPGAIGDSLAFNAGAALMVFGRAPSLKEGIRIAQEALKQGKALQTLDKWVEV